jgi:hypothetical protein
MPFGLGGDIAMPMTGYEGLELCDPMVPGRLLIAHIRGGKSVTVVLPIGVVLSN